jgi:hypothetical protein
MFFQSKYIFKKHLENNMELDLMISFNQLDIKFFWCRENLELVNTLIEKIKFYFISFQPKLNVQPHVLSLNFFSFNMILSHVIECRIELDDFFLLILNYYDTMKKF